jgi:hypothetical protein
LQCDYGHQSKIALLALYITSCPCLWLLKQVQFHIDNVTEYVKKCQTLLLRLKAYFGREKCEQNYENLSESLEIDVFIQALWTGERHGWDGMLCTVSLHKILHSVLCYTH